VLEELIHLGQHRSLGWAKPTSSQIIRLEVEAQKKLIQLGLKRGFSQQEMMELYRNLEYWQGRLP
jgi:hypothetical protein